MRITLRGLVLILRKALLKNLLGGQLTLFAVREREDDATITFTEEWNGGKVDGTWMLEVTTWTITIARSVAKVPDPTHRD